MPTAVPDRLRAWERRYSAGEERPLGGYAALLGIYGGATAAMIGWARSRGTRLPERLAAADLALLAIGTFRASRLITKDSVTAFARAPFTRFQGPAGEGEVHEEVGGHGFRHATGELVSCPFCIAVWLATAGVFAMVTYPRAARAVCSVLAVEAGSDLLQYGYSALREVEHR